MVTLGALELRCRRIDSVSPNFETFATNSAYLRGDEGKIRLQNGFEF
jgi:hypothetical protein